MVRNRRGLFPPPIDDIERYWTPEEKHHAQGMLACSIVGSLQTVKAGLERFVDETRADELMIVSAIFDPAARRRSIELIAKAAALEARPLT
jgi:alkanesulfonate monooxygenase SsuD/methylene tetrahydromethanopterin reductase-like flavin-dependent oxidoreductase (luciferase family)